MRAWPHETQLGSQSQNRLYVTITLAKRNKIARATKWHEHLLEPRLEDRSMTTEQDHGYISSLTHLLTDFILTWLLAHSSTHSLTHSLTHLLSCLPTCPYLLTLLQKLSESLTCFLTYLLFLLAEVTYSLTCAQSDTHTHTHTRTHAHARANTHARVLSHTLSLSLSLFPFSRPPLSDSFSDSWTSKLMRKKRKILRWCLFRFTLMASQGQAARLLLSLPYLNCRVDRVWASNGIKLAHSTGTSMTPSHQRCMYWNASFWEIQSTPFASVQPAHKPWQAQ